VITTQNIRIDRRSIPHQQQSVHRRLVRRRTCLLSCLPSSRLRLTVKNGKFCSLLDYWSPNQLNPLSTVLISANTAANSSIVGFYVSCYLEYKFKCPWKMMKQAKYSEVVAALATERFIRTSRPNLCHTPLSQPSLLRLSTRKRYMHLLKWCCCQREAHEGAGPSVKSTFFSSVPSSPGALANAEAHRQNLIVSNYQSRKNFQTRETWHCVRNRSLWCLTTSYVPTGKPCYRVQVCAPETPVDAPPVRWRRIGIHETMRGNEQKNDIERSTHIIMTATDCLSKCRKKAATAH